MSLLKLAHQVIQQTIQTGDSVIDATVGNGYDTLFLAEQVGRAGQVYGFDIQQTALNSAAQRLDGHEQVTLILASHSDMKQHIPREQHGNIKAVMFNLGYLPKGDKSIITQSQSTLIALNAACNLLADNGIITVLVYTGHQGGMDEAHNIEDWLTQSNYPTSIQLSNIPKPDAPKLFIITKNTNLEGIPCKNSSQN